MKQEKFNKKIIFTGILIFIGISVLIITQYSNKNKDLNIINNNEEMTTLANTKLWSIYQSNTIPTPDWWFQEQILNIKNFPKPPKIIKFVEGHIKNLELVKNDTVKVLGNSNNNIIFYDETSKVNIILGDYDFPAGGSADVAAYITSLISGGSGNFANIECVWIPGSGSTGIFKFQYSGGSGTGFGIDFRDGFQSPGIMLGFGQNKLPIKSVHFGENVINTANYKVEQEVNIIIGNVDFCKGIDTGIIINAVTGGSLPVSWSNALAIVPISIINAPYQPPQFTPYINITESPFYKEFIEPTQPNGELRTTFYFRLGSGYHIDPGSNGDPPFFYFNFILGFDTNMDTVTII